MHYRKKIILLFILVVLLIAIQFTLPNNPAAVDFYSNYIFAPYQSFRNFLFGNLPISIGDLLYIGLFISLFISLLRWIYFLVRFPTHKHYFGHSLMRMLIAVAIIYILFFIGWGGNYYKKPLSKYWELKIISNQNSASVLSFDSSLVMTLNQLAPHYHPLSFGECDTRAQQFYKRYTNIGNRPNGINAKASIFGNIMENFKIQGYYNPFTGEAQVNRYLPAYMLPFVVTHELAHQAGIAAEGDANLIAYAVSILSTDTSFLYSAYFNIWLYTNAQVRRRDSVAANLFRKQLNALTLRHIDTLKALKEKYNNDISEYSSYLYDEYLRLHNQKQGIHSYNNVVKAAWNWEQKRKQQHINFIRLP